MHLIKILIKKWSKFDQKPSVSWLFFHFWCFCTKMICFSSKMFDFSDKMNRDGIWLNVDQILIKFESNLILCWSNFDQKIDQKFDQIWSTFDQTGVQTDPHLRFQEPQYMIKRILYNYICFKNIVFFFWSKLRKFWSFFDHFLIIFWLNIVFFDFWYVFSVLIKCWSCFDRILIQMLIKLVQNWSKMWSKTVQDCQKEPKKADQNLASNKWSKTPQNLIKYVR